MSILCSNCYQLNVFFDTLSGICVTRMPVWSHSWSLHGLYTHVYHLPQPPMEEGATGQLGVHRHQFGENPLWYQCFRYIRWPLSCKEVDILFVSEWMWMTYMKYLTIESGEVQTAEQDWEEYFADPLQWWDCRFYKVSLGILLRLLVSWC